ncbi:MAG: phosphoribosylglycinamide synthetase C domain-containing protein, partial [Chloroflexota bacterium]
RVLAVSAKGIDVETAVKRAYAAINEIHFEGAHYRRDIGTVSAPNVFVNPCLPLVNELVMTP